MNVQVNVACTAEEVGSLRGLVLRAYGDARARAWPFLSDVLEVALRGTQEEDRAIVASAVHALTRYDRLTAFAARSDDPGARLDALFALTRPESPEAGEVEERLGRVEGAVERLGIRYSFPDWLVEAVGDESLLARMNETPPRVARVNTLKTTREACLSSLAAEGVSAHATARAAQGIVFEGRRSPFRTEAFSRGDFEMQDEASQLVAELVAPPPKSLVVDACAGAGGKTLALAAALAGKGKVMALDPSNSKLTELRRRARRAGASNVQALPVDLVLTTPRQSRGRAVPGELIELGSPAARVVVDAPCTGLGAMRRNPEARWRLRPGDIGRLNEAQSALTRAAAKLVGDNGRLIYATCSFLPSEGEQIVESFLAEHRDFALMTARDVMGRARTEGVATPDGKYLRTWQPGGGGGAPDGTSPASPGRGPDQMDGFFAAVLRRVGG
jgi:16S rRNA (cytosine967-C5)-methyltransferase